MPPKKKLKLDSFQRKLSTFFTTNVESDTTEENPGNNDEIEVESETTDEQRGSSEPFRSEERKFEFSFSESYMYSCVMYSFIQSSSFRQNLYYS